MPQKAADSVMRLLQMLISPTGPHEEANTVAMKVVSQNMFGALLLAGIMAAVLSSASTFLSLVGFSASNDIGIHKSDDEKKTLRFSRVMMLVIGTIALIAGCV